MLRGFRRSAPATAGDTSGQAAGPLSIPPAPISRLLGAVALVMAAGVLLVALADAAARRGESSSHTLFWVGLVLVVAPPAARLCSPSPGRSERLWLAVMFGLGMYLAKVTYNPVHLSFSDEFVHVRSVQDDLLNGRLFSFNPLLPEAARYPGLGDITGGLVRLTGLPVSTAGLLVIGSARLVLVLAIFLLAERLSGSARVAGLACLLYGANPNFLYWSAQFSYESLALPLVVFTLYLIARRSAPGSSPRISLLAAASILAVVITHHLSSYFLATVLVVWSVVVLWRRRRGAVGEYSPHRLAALALIAIGVWLSAVATVTGQYLGSIASSTGQGLFNVITGASATRTLFKSGTQVAPAWERALSIAAVLLTLAGLAFGAYVIWRRRRERALMFAPLVLAVAYPLLLPLRFIGGAAETANRSTEFLFLGLAAVLATSAVTLRARGRRHGWAATAGVAVLAAIVVLGGVAVSWQYSERLPETSPVRGAPYELSAQAISADQWAAQNLGRGRRFASDFLNHLGLAAYGEERPLYAPLDGVSAWQIMLPSHVEAAVGAALREGGVEYVLAERSLSEGIPASGFYYDKGEPEAGRQKRPMPLAVIGKFDHTVGASRLYDNGKEQIYSVGALR